MSLTALMVLEVVVDLTTVALSLWAVSRYLPLSWRATMKRFFKINRKIKETSPVNATVYGRMCQPAHPTAADRSDPVAPMDAYGQIPLLAATGLGTAQIVQKLGLSRGEVELALKMGRHGRAGANG